MCSLTGIVHFLLCLFNLTRVRPTFLSIAVRWAFSLHFTMPHENADLHGEKVHIFLVCPSFRWQFPQVDKLPSFWVDARPMLSSNFRSSRVPSSSSKEILSTVCFCFVAYLSSGMIIRVSFSSVSSLSESTSDSPPKTKPNLELSRSGRSNFFRAWALTFCFGCLSSVVEYLSVAWFEDNVATVGDSNSVAFILMLFYLVKMPLIWILK